MDKRNEAGRTWCPPSFASWGSPVRARHAPLAKAPLRRGFVCPEGDRYTRIGRNVYIVPTAACECRRTERHLALIEEAVAAVREAERLLPDDAHLREERLLLDLRARITERPRRARRLTTQHADRRTLDRGVVGDEAELGSPRRLGLKTPRSQCRSSNGGRPCSLFHRQPVRARRGNALCVGSRRHRRRAAPCSGRVSMKCSADRATTDEFAGLYPSNRNDDQPTRRELRP